MNEEWERPINPYQEREEAWTLEEVERLKDMDQWLAAVSLSAIGELDNRTILDIGAGSGTTTEDLIRDNGGKYIALDTNPDYLKERESHPRNTIAANAEELPFADYSIDITHSRALTAWLGESRGQAIREQLRITQERAVFMNFDWSSVQGDLPVQRLRAFMSIILNQAGFMTEYGKIQEEEVREALDEQERGFQIANTTYSSYDRDICWQMVGGAVNTLVGQLEDSGKTTVANDLRRLREHFDEYMEDKYNTMSLPEIHATSVSFH